MQHQLPSWRAGGMPSRYGTRQTEIIRAGPLLETKKASRSLRNTPWGTFKSTPATFRLIGFLLICITLATTPGLHTSYGQNGAGRPGTSLLGSYGTIGLVTDHRVRLTDEDLELIVAALRARRAMTRGLRGHRVTRLIERLESTERGNPKWRITEDSQTHEDELEDE
jgi:hypothetical protein